jgi:hypothetical protein
MSSKFFCKVCGAEDGLADVKHPVLVETNEGMILGVYAELICDACTFWWEGLYEFHIQQAPEGGLH